MTLSPEFKKLEYNDKDRLFNIMRKKNSCLSEYSFTNAYLFREPHQYEIAIIEECIFLRGISYDGSKYLMPLCPLEKISLEKLNEVSEYADFFFPIEEINLKYFPEEYYEYSFNDGDSDYIYLTERLAAMAGRKLAKKRNLLKQYNETYQIKDVPLTQEKFWDAKSVLDMWEQEIQDSPNHGSDYKEALEALGKISDFNLMGMISYANGKPSGFVLGEELNDDTFVLHFAKAGREFKGVFQHLYKAFANMIVGKYKYMNFEQDLGKDSLRQAKSTYYPDDMMKKYRVRKRR